MAHTHTRKDVDADTHAVFLSTPSLSEIMPAAEALLSHLGSWAQRGCSHSSGPPHSSGQRQTEVSRGSRAKQSVAYNSPHPHRTGQDRTKEDRTGEDRAASDGGGGGQPKTAKDMVGHGIGASERQT